MASRNGLLAHVDREILQHHLMNSTSEMSCGLELGLGLAPTHMSCTGFDAAVQQMGQGFELVLDISFGAAAVDDGTRPHSLSTLVAIAGER